MNFSADLSELNSVLVYIRERLESVSCTERAVMEIQIAAEEVFVNIARYAYGTGDGKVSVDAQVTSETAVITFSDGGTPFDPLKKADPDITLPVSERAVGGLGIFMAKKLMDNISYEYRDGQNVLTMKKILA